MPRSERWVAKGNGSLVRRGRLPRAFIPPEYGSYKPTAATTGHLSASLIQHNDPSTVTYHLPSSLDSTAIADGWVPYKDGYALIGREVYGDLRAPSTHPTNIYLVDCLLRGGSNNPTTELGVVTCSFGTRSGTGKVILEDCTIDPQVKADGRNGIQGHRWEAYRCDISGVVDGMGIFATAAQGGACNVVEMGNYVHDLVYCYPGMGQDDGSHNDCCQYQGGSNVHSKGTNFEGTIGTIIGTPPSAALPRLTAGYCSNTLVIQDNVGQGTANVIFEDGWVSGGATQGNIKNITLTYRNMRHSWESRWNNVVVIKTGATVTDLGTCTFSDGPNAGQVLSTSNNGLAYVA